LCQEPNQRTDRWQQCLFHLSGTHEQHRDIDRMTYLVGSRPVQNVTYEAMPVRSHGDQIDIFLARELNDFIRRFA
jgi:hypothetical protein